MYWILTLSGLLSKASSDEVVFRSYEYRLNADIHGSGTAMIKW